MNVWEVQSCRACLLQDNVSAMYDLAVEDTLNLYNECSKIKISINTCDQMIPQYLCPMCYKMCELLQGFRERCYESERKLRRGLLTKKRKLSKGQLKEQQQVEVKSEPEPQQDAMFEDDQIDQNATYDTTDELPEDPLFRKAGSSRQATDTDWPDEDSEPEQDPDYDLKQPHRKVPKNSNGQTRNTTADKTDDKEYDFQEYTGAHIWKYFLRCKSRRWAKCRIEIIDGKTCDKILSMGSQSSSGSLHNHLKGCHKAEYASFKGFDF